MPAHAYGPCCTAKHIQCSLKKPQTAMNSMAHHAHAIVHHAMPDVASALCTARPPAATHLPRSNHPCLPACPCCLRSMAGGDQRPPESLWLQHNQKTVETQSIKTVEVYEDETQVYRTIWISATCPSSPAPSR